MSSGITLTVWVSFKQFSLFRTASGRKPYPLAMPVLIFLIIQIRIPAIGLPWHTFPAWRRRPPALVTAQRDFQQRIVSIGGAPLAYGGPAVGFALPVNFHVALAVVVIGRVQQNAGHAQPVRRRRPQHAEPVAAAHSHAAQPVGDLPEIGEQAVVPVLTAARNWVALAAADV